MGCALLRPVFGYCICGLCEASAVFVIGAGNSVAGAVRGFDYVPVFIVFGGHNFSDLVCDTGNKPTIKF